MAEDILVRPAPAGQIRISYGGEPAQFGDLRLPDGAGPHPVAVVLHGGYWRNRYSLDYMGHVCESLRVRGLASWNVEYRRLGDPGGGWPGTLLDVVQALDALRTLATTYPLDLHRVVTLGHSAGGHLAAWVAAQKGGAVASTTFSRAHVPICAVVSLAGVLDLYRGWELRLSDTVIESFIGGTPASQPQRFAFASPDRLLPSGVCQIAVHGTADANVPLELSERYAHAARRAGDDVRLLTLPGSGHFEIVDPLTSEWQTIVTQMASAVPELRLA